MIKVKPAISSELRTVSQSIRRMVFIDEQGRAEQMEWEHETEAHPFLAYIHQTPVGTARWRYAESGIELQRFAVLKEYRGLGVGKALLQHLLAVTSPLSPNLFLHSYLQTAEFYMHQGFIFDGAPYVYPDDGITYVKMIWAPTTNL